MTKTLKAVFDGSVFRPSGPVDLEAGKKYSITVKSFPEDPDVDQDPAFDIASLAVDTNIPDLSAEHDHYLYGSPKRGVHER
ncbi:MAG: antitoxin family protein [Candidatus Omnitrophota bacterium]|jgi:predicted DNA-binding antitoxin AbrB/MazE fold protein